MTAFVIGLFCIILGLAIPLFDAGKEIAVLLLICGIILILTGWSVRHRQRAVWIEKMEEYNQQIIKDRKKQIEEVQQRLHKIQIMIENSYRRRSLQRSYSLHNTYREKISLQFILCREERN